MRAKIPGIRVFGATVVTGARQRPTRRTASPEQDEKRKALNEFIRTSGLFDGVADFDKATLDPATGGFRPEFVPDSTTGGAGRQAASEPRRLSGDGDGDRPFGRGPRAAVARNALPSPRVRPPPGRHERGEGCRGPARPNAAHPADVQRIALVLLVLSGVVNYIDRATLAVANPLIRQELGPLDRRHGPAALGLPVGLRLLRSCRSARWSTGSGRG